MLNNQKELILLKDLGYLYPTATSKQKKLYAIYKCLCGNEFKAEPIKIRNNHTKSCGCLHTTHGLRSHRLYTTWSNMIKRCNNPKNKFYSYYGGRGITICDEWLNVTNFINDMFPSYVEGLSLDRIDSDGNYELNNCRWTTKAIQSQNTRRLSTSNTSGYRGVYFDKKINKWVSNITVNKKRIIIGNFIYKINAAKAYDDYVIINKLNHTINNV